MTIDLVTATAEDFDPYIGTVFVTEIEGQSISLILDNVKRSEITQSRDNHLEIEGVVYPPRAYFALTFEGPVEPQLSSIIYNFKHESLGDIQLFISPFRRDHNSMLYESAFS